MQQKADSTGGRTLICTIGTEAQVVTATLDLLARQRTKIDAVYILHTVSEDEMMRAALERLKAALPSANGTPLAVRYAPILDPSGNPCRDLDSAAASEAFFRQIYRLIWRLKQSAVSIDLCPAGGRKTMAMYAMAAAQLLFDEDDRLWHLFSGGEFLASKRLHPTPTDQAQLVRIPLIHWAQASPTLTALRSIDDPYMALARVEELRLREKVFRAEWFVRSLLSSAERRVVEPLVCEGLSDLALAKRLYLSPRTVERHLRSAYDKASEYWQLPERMTRAQLITYLQLYYSTRIEGKPS